MGTVGAGPPVQSEKHRTVEVSCPGEARVLARCLRLGLLGSVWRPGWGGALGRDPQEKLQGLWEDREPRSSQ